MIKESYFALLLFCLVLSACSNPPMLKMEAEPIGAGQYTVGSTNMEVASEYAGLEYQTMHEYLLGLPDENKNPRYLADILKHPESAWLIDVPVPEDQELYGPASGKNLAVVSYITYPSSKSQNNNTYAFPYEEAIYGKFEDMLAQGETPNFADPKARYPLIIYAHGNNAHNIYDIEHAHQLASHGYIVAVINYGDERTKAVNRLKINRSYLRPLITKAVIDSLIQSDIFGDHIDRENIGVSGHSFGGYTALAIAGGQLLENPKAVTDERIKAVVLTAPWVGYNNSDGELFLFGKNNLGLNNVSAPVLTLYGTADDITLPSYILPATKQLAGPSYVVKFVDQNHALDDGSWEDRNNWELLFFNAYLKSDKQALKTLQTADSMKGGNEDHQLFDYQRLSLIDF